MKKKKILFVCVQNSARSQMAEALMKEMGGEHFDVQSAGLEPGSLNPLAIEVMAEIGIDISQNEANDVFEFYKEGRRYAYVITVCDKTAAERCPVFPGIVNRLHWSFEDPASFTGSHEEKIEKTRLIRDQIKKKVKEFIDIASR